MLGYFLVPAFAGVGDVSSRDSIKGTSHFHGLVSVAQHSFFVVLPSACSPCGLDIYLLDLILSISCGTIPFFRYSHYSNYPTRLPLGWTMALRPSLLTRNLTSGTSDTGSPAEQRDDAKKNMLKAMRPLPTQHYWNIYFDRYAMCWQAERWPVSHRATCRKSEANSEKGSKRINRRAQMGTTLRLLKSWARKSSRYRISGATTTIPP